jgi:hypothetical protein
MREKQTGARQDHHIIERTSLARRARAADDDSTSATNGPGAGFESGGNSSSLPRKARLCRVRQRQRGISNELLQVAHDYGTAYHRRGAVLYFFGDKTYERLRNEAEFYGWSRSYLSTLKRARGIHVVVAHGSEKILTTYRNNGSKVLFQ